MLLALRGSFAIIPEPARPEPVQDSKGWEPPEGCAAAVAVIAAAFVSTDGRAAESLRIEGIVPIV